MAFASANANCETEPMCHELHVSSSPPSTQDSVGQYGEILRQWAADLRHDPGADLVYRFLSNCEVVAEDGSQISVECTDPTFGIDRRREAFSAFAQMISLGRLGLDVPNPVSGAVLLPSPDLNTSRGRGYSVSFETPPTIAAHHDGPAPENPNDYIIGEFAAMKADVNLTTDAAQEGSDATPVLIVEIAADVLGTKEWRLRGVSTLHDPDEFGRAILAFCFMTQRLCDAKAFADHMGYESVDEIAKDAEDGAELMQTDRDAARLGKLLNTELSRLPMLQFESFDEYDLPFDEGDDETASGDNVIAFPKSADGCFPRSKGFRGLM